MIVSEVIIRRAYNRLKKRYESKNAGIKVQTHNTDALLQFPGIPDGINLKAINLTFLPLNTI